MSLILVSSCISVRDEHPRIRHGVRILDPEIDMQKPVSAAEFSGWHQVNHSSTLVGVLDRHWLVAYDFNARKMRWFTKMPEAVAGPISVSGDRILVGEQDGTLHCIEAKSGKEKWRATLDSFVGRPASVVKDRVYIVSSGQQLYNLSLETGRPQWIYDAGFPEQLSLQGGSAPLVLEDTVYLGLNSGELRAINIVTGRPAWRYETQDVDSRFHDVMGDMAFHDGRLVFSRYDGQITALAVTASQFMKVWEEKITNVSATVIKKNQLVVGTHLGEVIAYAVDTGKKLWTATTGTPITNLLIHKGTIFSVGSSGRINAIELSSGKIYWHDEIQGRVLSTPFIVGQNIYFTTGYNNLYGYYAEELDNTPYF